MASSTSQSWTVLSLLQWCQDFFTKQGLDGARLDAELLLAHTLHLKRIQLYVQFERPINADELAHFKTLVLRRTRDREPTAYILGTRDFWTLTLHVSPAVLIPRPETEHVVEAALAFVQLDAPWSEAPLRIVDVGTGSGAIILALASELADVQLWATDISTDALDVARHNAQRLDLAERVSFIHCDLLEGLTTDDPLDLIVSNPPYVADHDVDDLAPEVVRHEPRQALFAGPQGLDLIDRLAQQAAARLRPAGGLICEIGAGQADAVCACFERHGFEDITRHQDLAGHERVISGRLADHSATASKRS